MVTKEEKRIWEDAALFRRGYDKAERHIREKKKKAERELKKKRKEEEKHWKKMRAEVVKAEKLKAKKVAPRAYVVTIPKGVSKRRAIGLAILRGAKKAAQLGVKGAAITARELAPKKRKKRVKIKIGTRKRKKKRKRKRKRRR